MSLKSELSARTTGANRIQITADILQEISFEPRVKNSKVVLVSKAEYGFWRWKDSAHTQKENCDPGDWIIIEGLNLSFKNQLNFDAAEYGVCTMFLM